MGLTALDIKKQPFKRIFRGFDPTAVVSFLDHVANEFQTIIQQNDAYATKVKCLEEQLLKYKDIELLLSDTLMTAQKTTDEARVNAQKEADWILKDAQTRASRFEDEARNRVSKLDNELISIRNQRDSFLARFKSILKTQLDLLEVISGDLRGDDRQEQAAPQPPRQQQIRTQPQRSAAADDDMIEDVPPQPVIIG